MYTLIQTAKLNDVDPQAWLADVLVPHRRHAAEPARELLPWNWTADCPSARRLTAALGEGLPCEVRAQPYEEDERFRTLRLTRG